MRGGLVEGPLFISLISLLAVILEEDNTECLNQAFPTFAI